MDDIPIVNVHRYSEHRTVAPQSEKRPNINHLECLPYGGYPSIYQKAQQEHAKAFRQEILNKLEGLPADMPDWREALKNAIDDIIQSEEPTSTKVQQEAKKNPGISPEKNPRPHLCAVTES